jgi:hypothetical protein
MIPAPPPAPPSPADKEVQEIPTFEARFGEKKLVYNDLCNRCRETLEKLFTQMKEWTRDRKETLLGTSGPKLGANQAAPLNVPPNYSPPKPHSGGVG